MALGIYEKGDLVRCTGTFKNASGVAIDPTAVFFSFLDPSGTTTSYTYGVDAALVRESAGVYYVDVNANATGIWKYRFYATGTGQAADEEVFEIRSSYF